jgi:hypothetical protein
MSSALPVHHGNSSASLFVQHICPSSLGVILKFLRMINSIDSSSSILVELNFSVVVNGSNSLLDVNCLYVQSSFHWKVPSDSFSPLAVTHKYFPHLWQKPSIVYLQLQ